MEKTACRGRFSCFCDGACHWGSRRLTRSARYCSASTLANWIGIEFSRRPYRSKMKSHARTGATRAILRQGATRAWEVTYWSSCAPAARKCAAAGSVNRWVDVLGAVNAANRAINMQIAALLASSLHPCAISSASGFALIVLIINSWRG